MRRVPVRLLTALAIILAAAGPAAAGSVLRLHQPAPGSPDVVATWASEEPGPFALLRRVVPPNERVSDALPLDPVADAFLDGLVAGPLLLPGAATPGAQGTTVYQLRDVSGSCSTAGYVVRMPLRFLNEDVLLQLLAWPRQSGLADVRALMQAHPQITAVVHQPPDDCRAASIRRRPDGSLEGRNVALAGRSFSFHGSGDLPLVIVGASMPGAQGVLPAFPACAPSSRHQELELPAATRWRESIELLCGERGVDWQDADEDGNPDTCTEGLWVGSSVSVIQVRFDGRVDFPVNHAAQLLLGRLHFTGTEWIPAPGRGLVVRRLAPDSGARILDLRDAGADAACACADGDGDGADDCTERLDGSDPADAASFGPDLDGDGVRDATDACPLDADPLQADTDGDGDGDACDPCPLDSADGCVDPDGDGHENPDDNCRTIANADQANSDTDELGDACDECFRETARVDPDADGCDTSVDDCPDTANAQGFDADGDGRGDACDPCASLGTMPDTDGDGCQDDADSCPHVEDDQADADLDGVADACDCAPSDAGISRPREVLMRALHFTGPPVLALTWDADPAFAGLGSEFDVISGQLRALHEDGGFARASCTLTGLPTSPAFLLVVGDSWHLVRERTDACRGSYGRSLVPDGSNLRWALDVDHPPDCP